jgi:acyl dehydratase
MAETFLTSFSHSNFVQQSDLTPLQIQMDGLVSTVAEKTADGYALAGIILGGGGGRAFHRGTLSLFSPLANFASRISAPLSQLTARVVGFAAESALFGITPNIARAALQNGNLSLLQLHGEEGLGKIIVHSGINLMGFRVAGVLSAQQSAMAQAILQTSAILGTQQASAFAGITDASRNSFGHQIIDAQSSVLTMWAGIHCLHQLTPNSAPRQSAKVLEIEAKQAGITSRRKYDSHSSLKPAAQLAGRNGVEVVAYEPPKDLNNSLTKNNEGNPDPFLTGPDVRSLRDERASILARDEESVSEVCSEDTPPLALNTRSVSPEVNQWIHDVKINPHQALYYSLVTHNTYFGRRGYVSTGMLYSEDLPPVHEATREAIRRSPSPAIFHSSEEVTHYQLIRMEQSRLTIVRRELEGEENGPQKVLLIREKMSNEAERLSLGKTEYRVGEDLNIIKPEILTPEELQQLPQPTLSVKITPGLADGYNKGSGDYYPAYVSDTAAQELGFPGRIFPPMAIFNLAEKALYKALNFQIPETPFPLTPFTLKANFQGWGRMGDTLDFIVIKGENNDKVIVLNQNHELITVLNKKLAVQAGE